MPQNLIVVGPAGSGKTGLIERIVKRLPYTQGVLTRKHVDGPNRVRYQAYRHDGTNYVIAAKGIQLDGNRIGEYRVDHKNLDLLLEGAEAVAPGAALYMDAIAPMQLLSERFCRTLHRYLNAPNTLIATCDEASFPLMASRQDLRIFSPGEYERIERAIMGARAP